jgi:hypothetical protein
MDPSYQDSQCCPPTLLCQSSPAKPAPYLSIEATRTEGLTKLRGLRAYPEMGYEAGVKAMLDAKITYDDVETGVACYCYGDATSGQQTFYQFWNVRHSNLQHQQYLCHWINWTCPCEDIDQERGCRLCLGDWLLNRCSLVRSRAFGMTGRVRWAY